MRGRKISSGKVDSARELRRKGYSVREIARRLRISKSAAHRFTQGISTELADEVVEQEGMEAAEPEALEVTLPVPEQEQEDPELVTLREQLDDLRFEVEVAAMDRDTIAAARLQRKLSQHMRMINRYFQRRFRAIGYRPYSDYSQQSACYSQPRDPELQKAEDQLNSELAAIMRDQREELAALERDLGKDIEREKALVIRDLKKYAQRYLSWS